MSEFRRLLFPSGTLLVDNFRPVQDLGSRTVLFSVGGTNIFSETTMIPNRNPSSGASNKPTWSYVGDTGMLSFCPCCCIYLNFDEKTIYRMCH